MSPPGPLSTHTAELIGDDAVSLPRRAPAMALGERVRRLLPILSGAVLVSLVLGASAMWLRSMIWRYDLLWLWISPDCRLVLNSYGGTLYAYAQDIAPGDPDAGRLVGDERLGHWDLPTTCETVEWDYPVFDRQCLGLSAGVESFLADSRTTRAGAGVPYWMLLASSCSGLFCCVAILRRCRAAGAGPSAGGRGLARLRGNRRARAASDC